MPEIYNWYTQAIKIIYQPTDPSHCHKSIDRYKYISDNVCSWQQNKCFELWVWFDQPIDLVGPNLTTHLQSAIVHSHGLHVLANSHLQYAIVHSHGLHGMANSIYSLPLSTLMGCMSWQTGHSIQPIDLVGPNLTTHLQYAIVHSHGLHVMANKALHPERCAFTGIRYIVVRWIMHTQEHINNNNNNNNNQKHIEIQSDNNTGVAATEQF